MNFKKIKKIVACVAALTCVGTNIVASAAVNTNSDTQSVINGINPSDENVLKVDVDDSGEVTYTVPASASKYGDVTYDENRPFLFTGQLRKENPDEKRISRILPDSVRDGGIRTGLVKRKQAS